MYFFTQLFIFFLTKEDYDLKHYKPSVEFSKKIATGNVLPNIYFLIADSYTSNNLLQSEFNYNNISLHSFLIQQGFFIADSSTSNYFHSPLSIAGTLNLGYLPKAEKPKDQNDLILFSGLRMLQEPTLVKFLREENYELINLSPFSIRNSKSQLEAYYKGGSDNDLIKINTIENFDWLQQLTQLIQKVTNGRYQSKFKNKIIRVFNDMQTITNYLTQASIGQSDKPKFVYVHTDPPHPPFVIDSTGKNMPLKFTMDTSRVGYIRQLAFVNTYLKKWVSHIRKNDTSAIIILQGDHGFRAFPMEQNKTDAFKILNAMYFPNQDYQGLYNTISSVNTFRVVLNKYFQQNLPLLKDSSFFPNF